MTFALPQFADVDAFDVWRRDPAGWLPAALDVARSAGLPTGDPTVFATGTNLVLGLGPGLILKIFPPQLSAQFQAERASLGQLTGRLSLPIPRLIGEGERDGWPWLAMTRLGGVLGSEAWPHLPEAEKERALGEIGLTIATVQAVPPGPIAALGQAWPDFIAGQIGRCRARQIRLGLPERYLEELEAMLAAAPAVVPTSTRSSSPASISRRISCSKSGPMAGISPGYSISATSSQASANTTCSARAAS